jgi:hypothetical protein
MVMGWIQFGICYRVNQKVGGVVIGILAVAAMIGYAGVDYGIYASTKIPVSGVEGTKDGEYQLSDLITFGGYVRGLLGASTIPMRDGSGSIEIGAGGTGISYVADLAGALLGAAGMLFYSATRRPYCERCSRYKKLEEKREIRFEYEENLANEVFGKIRELTAKAVHDDMVSYCRELAETYQGSDGGVKIVFVGFSLTSERSEDGPLRNISG